MRIRTTIWLGMLAVAVGYVTTVVTHDLASRRNDTFLDHLDKTWVPAVHAAQKAVFGFNQTMVNYQDGVVSGDQQALDRARSNARSVATALENITALSNLPDRHQASVAEVSATLSTFVREADSVYRRMATPATAGLVPPDTLRKLTETASGIRAALDAQETALQDELRGTIAGQRRDMATQRLLSELTMIALLLAAIAGIAVLTMRWSYRLQQLIGASQRLSQGDYTTPIGLQGSDEIGRLGEQTEVMRQAVCDRDHSLRVFNETLEQQISERTRELQQRNSELSTEIAERQRAETNLRTAQLEAEAMLASLGSAMIGLDEGDRVTRWNLAAEKLFGQPAKEVIGRPFGECGIRCDWAEVFLAIERCASTGQMVEIPSMNYDGPLGDSRWMSVLLSPSRSQDGSRSGLGRVVLLASDITQRRIEEDQAGQHAKLESIGQLAAGIAHEINTPIQFIGDNLRFLAESREAHLALRTAQREAMAAQPPMSPADLQAAIAGMEERYDIAYLDEETPKAISQSLEGVCRVTEIIKAMKSFSHPDQGSTTLLDINAAVRTTIEVSRNEYKYVADVVTTLDPQLPSVSSHAGAIHQVLLNLVVNAAQAIAEVAQATGKRGCISITTAREADEVVISISDTGGGIPVAIQPKIFTPFFTTKGVGKGTGQGLHIAYNIIEKQHGGRITFASTENQGTTFVVRLPVR